MPKAEFIAFNSEWHKDCAKCKAAYGAESLDGLRAFFSAARSAGDGFYSWCKVCCRERNRIIEKSEKRKERDRAKRVRDPQKYKARASLNNWIAAGKVVKPKSCSMCSSTGRIHGHHHDYSKPVDVIWVCSACHSLLHKKEAA